MNFSKIVKKRLDDIDKSTYQLGKDCGRTSGWIYTILQRGYPSLRTLKLIVNKLGGKVVIKFEHEEHEI